MTLKLLPFKATLNKAYQKVKPNRSDIELFKVNLARLLDRIDHEESEENVKNHLRDFLNDTWYKHKHLVNTKGRTDLVIHEDLSPGSPAAVLFEVKRPKNAADMVTTTNLNAKAMHELVLYYLRERVEHQNTDIKYLVITNVYDWYIFEGALFDRLFYQDKKLLKEYEKWRSGQKVDVTTDLFYKDIARPHLEDLKEELAFAHFNLKEFTTRLPLTPKGGPTDAKLSELQKGRSSEGKTNIGSPLGVRGQDAGPADNKLIPLFKIFSPQHLLRQSFANDSNTLNEGFYKELLYLIGLEEEKEGGKKLIRRCAPERRLPGSLLENTINIIQYEDRMRHVRSNDVFEVALELCITWVNRLLFLKLLESQLVKYHGGDASYRFLTSKLIKDFDALNKLFFQVLAEKPEQRPEAIKATFDKVPYLNSSLFEITEMESAAIRINSLEDELTLPIYARSVLRNNARNVETLHATSLHYLFAFLDAYDFASEGSEEIQEDNKALINASVLGLIFEKINGYRDGSFFTPGFITMYMCRETVRRAVVQKFNQHYGIDCADFGDLCNFAAKHYKREDVLAMNRLVNSLRICDPAVGSGHFLVSALNELLSVKSELGILADAEGNVLRGYAAKVENDELIVTCNDGQDLFEYRLVETLHATSLRGAGRDAQRVQETIFHEKQTVIENCLFGVDINPNSVKICRLRLWIELLKNTYYKTGTDAGGLETLPNIDINIKTGNSLISRFALDADLSKALKSVKYDIGTYRRYVQEYHHATDKETKRGLLALIEQIKSDFRTEIHRNDKINKLRSKLAGELYNLTQQGSLFGMTEAEAKKRKAEADKIEKELEKVEAQIKEIADNKLFENAFEWRFEFPEVLDAEGKFVGFDVVVGNPPYIRQEEFSALKPYLQSNYQTYSGTADLLVYFIELGMKLLRDDGVFDFIISNKFMRANFGKNLREWLQQYRIIEILDFGDLPVFEEATTYPCTINLQKAAPTGDFFAANIKELETVGFSSYVDSLRFVSSQSSLTSEGWNLSDTKVQQLLEKLKGAGIPLGEYVEGKIYYGIKTGYNEAFVIDEITKQRLIAEDARSAEVIKPFLAGREIKRYITNQADKYLIFTRRGIELESYPALLRFLEQFKDNLMPQPKGWTGSNWNGRKAGTYKWYEIQDAVDYYEEFEMPKIIYPNILKRPEFTFDKEGLYTNQKCFIISLSDYYLLGVLNSKIIHFLFEMILPKLRGGFFEPSSIFFTKFPIPSVSEEKKKPIITLVTQILTAKQADPQADTSALEREVDKLVYQLYGLTEEEVRIVEGV